MRILVTGGLGTVGAGLITELRQRGHHVVSCDLQHQPDEIGFSLRTDVEVPLYARCDVGEFRQIERVFEQRQVARFVADIVQHGLDEPRFSLGPRQCQRSFDQITQPIN